MLTKEEFEALPVKAQAAFTLEGDSFVPAKDAKLKQTLDGVDAKYQAAKAQLAELEQGKAAAIEEARSKALEEARSKGDVKAVEERYQQQMADLEKRTTERVRNETLKEFTTKQAAEKSTSIAMQIGLSQGIDEDDGYAIADLIRNRVKVDPDTGKEVYYNADGSALSVDKAGFIEELKKESRFKRLMKGHITTVGGGMVNGSTGLGSASAGAGKVDGSKDERAAYFATKFKIK